MQAYKMDSKFLEILVNIVREQNEQLLTIIAHEEDISQRTLAHFLPVRYDLTKQLNAFVASSQTRRSRNHCQ
jgi:hypothetical protein